MVFKRKNINPTIDSRLHISISIAIAVCILLILGGIWNAQKTADTAELNITTSIEAQQLSNALRAHQDAMSNAIELAVSSGEAQWRTNYENSLLNLQKVIYSTSLSVRDPIMTHIQTRLNDVVRQERELFNAIASGRIELAFEMLSSDKYQEQKIEQEQLAFTLRAILDKKSKDVINELNRHLNQTIMALILQIGLIAVIWYYIIRVIRHWQRAQSQHSDQLTRLAHYDSLTGIGNRALFQIRLAIAFKQSKRNGRPVGLLLMDIDHFKDINDNLGHDIGDDLLIRVAEEVQRCCRETDTVVRLGGDEFAIIITDLEEKRDTAILGQKILSIFEKPLHMKNHHIKTGTSIGFAFYPDDARSAEELLRKADMALYEAKRNGRAHFKYFDQAIETRARRKIAIQQDLQHALDHDEFILYYQPIFDISRDIMVGVESLLRWNHPQRGLIGPDEFIDIAEESRQIVPIGEWVLRTSCAQQVAWVKKGLPSLSIAVNLSGVQFNEHNLLDCVKNIMHETGIQKDYLTLEITESTLMEKDGGLIERLNALNDLGLKLAIDDFGTGYSSLAYLKRFPIHHLKIDREFIKELPHNMQDVAISRSIIKMAHELGIQVVAEGIEEKAQFDFLNQSECNFGQGYYFGKPMTASALEQKIQIIDQAYTNVHRIVR